MPPKRGLQTELHPALRTSNLNLLKVKRPRSGSPRSLASTTSHDNANVDNDGTDPTGTYITPPLPNPYLADSSRPGSRDEREYGPKRRLLRFHQKGEIVRAVAEQRAKAKQLAQEQHFRELQLKVEEEERRELVRKGELPDVSIGEDKYLPDFDGANTPSEILEWWDIPYVEIKKGSSYRILDRFTFGGSNSKRKQRKRKEGETSIDHDEETDDESEPSILYVWHPELIKDKEEGEKEGSGLLKRVYLTKNEQKRLRRSRRQLQREEHELRIKLGLDPKPEPKVKLSNMMRVVENSSNILDPTKYEQQVKQQVDQRRQRHELMNSERHEAAVIARKERVMKFEDTHSGTESMCYVYKFKSLSNPKIRYKLHMNSKQLKLKGCCLRIGEDGPGIIIAVGDEKQCKFFDNLVSRRIKWTDDYIDKSNNQKIDMSENFIKTEWSGYINTATTHKFVTWFMKSCSSEEELLKVLDEFNARQFYQR